MTTLQPDALEEIFLKLEEESERRALEAEDAAHSPNIPDLAVPARRAARRTHGHRGSVSISRFGHVDDPVEENTLGPSHTPPAFVRDMTTIAPFYGAQLHNHSEDSLSDESVLDDAGHTAESEHVTQVHRIAGRRCLRRSVEGIWQRTLARSRSKNRFSSSDVDTNVVIGVVVEEDHVEDPEPRHSGHAKAYVHAPSTLRPQSSRMTLPGAGTRDTNGSWRSKARELFKRKNRPRRSTLWTRTPSQQSYF